MKMSRIVATLLVGAALVGAAAPLAGQGAEKFTARLIWVPISGANRADVTGKGSVTATLTGTKLAITGSFEGLAAPATVARLHEGVALGARGRALADLTVTKSASGTITGSAELTKPQIESLRQGKLYVQVHSEKGVEPDGSNLWGWFLK